MFEPPAVDEAMFENNFTDEAPAAEEPPFVAEPQPEPEPEELPSIFAMQKSGADSPAASSGMLTPRPKAKVKPRKKKLKPRSRRKSEE